MNNRLYKIISLVAVGMLAVGCVGYNPEGKRPYTYVDWENGRALVGQISKDFDRSESTAKDLGMIGESKYGPGCHKGSLHDQNGEGFDGYMCNWGRRK